MVEMLPPPKAAVLAYLEGSGAEPERRAYAVLNVFNYSDGAQILQVEVGPLPSPTFYRHLALGKQTPQIHIHSRPGSTPEYNELEVVLAPMFEVLDPILEEVVGYSYNTCEDKCLTWTDSAPRGIVREERKFIFYRAVQGLYLHPIGLEVYVDTAGLNASAWHVEKIQFAGQLWDNVTAIAEWYDANNRTTPGFEPWKPTDEELKFSTFYPREEPPHRPEGGRPGPAQYEPAGKRYSVRGKQISWMGWQLNLGLRSSCGMRLWDVRFNGTRVAYELSLQQASAAYGGDPASSPFQAQTFYFDSAWGMGSAHLPLVPGSDCPETATYFDFSHLWDSHEPIVNRNSMCVFEWDTGMPLRRHHQHHTDPKWVGSMKSYALVVRSISTVYNYDYAWTHTFYTDGTIEVKVQAFGYLQTTRFEPAHGYKTSPDAGGTVHDHVLHWKVDLDIAGVNNSVQKDKIVPETIKMPWHPSVSSFWGRRIQREMPETEDKATTFINPNHPTYTMIVNENELNRFGASRGYRIDHHSYTYPLIPDDAWIMRAASFMKYHIAVTAHKDNELFSSTIFDQATPAEPVLRFEDYIDGDSVRNTDLVAWVSAGTWHIPVSEDAPSTPSTGASVGFVLRPYNYFSEDAALHTQEINLMERPSESSPLVVDTGMKAVKNCVAEEPITLADVADTF
ncbi:hypothetical protein HYH03_011293 [Edaphochlamys debaryana]|uniref:Amine oxidase n=1 Tax=Edaphochlamys debaryana TaxID=47281 RepID=A0A836BV77_9CHLO|nr:hypothetical protein HYH03_011293 [Edaphochlamys debaryana]|eukprot:KAG2490346.1 hypothetical protein HYH03_011293 [Edaphochlamys debaryana]